MNDVDLKVFVHLEVDVLHVHLVQVYQRLVLQCDALLNALHLEVSLETGVICMFSITNLSWLNKMLCVLLSNGENIWLFLQIWFGDFLFPVQSAFSLFSKFLSIMSEIRIRASCIFVIVFIWRFSIIRKSFSWKVLGLLFTIVKLESKDFKFKTFKSRHTSISIYLGLFPTNLPAS